MWHIPNVYETQTQRITVGSADAGISHPGNSYDEPFGLRMYLRNKMYVFK